MEQKPERKYLKIKVDKNRTFPVEDFDLSAFIAAVEKRQPTGTLEGGKRNSVEPVQVKMYPLPDRSYLTESVIQKLKKFKPSMDREKKTATCKKKRSKFAHQEMLAAYYNAHNPYHGILIYHGMGSGKTCSSVAMAENLAGNQKPIWVLTPKALESNYRAEMLKCSEIYKESQCWMQDRGVWKVTQGDPNFDTLSPKEQQDVRTTLYNLIEKHHAYRFVSYSGVSCQNIRAQFNSESNPFDASIVVIDEVHLLVELIAKNMKNTGSPYPLMYEWLLDAQDCRVVALSGTPRANHLSDLGILFNMLYGYIKVWTLKTAKLIEDTKLKRFVHQQKSHANELQVTRTPYGFEAVYDETGAFVQLRKVHDTWDNHKFKTELSKHAPVVGDVQKHKLLPDIPGPFVSREVFQQRVVGLISFFPDLSKLMPKMNHTRVHEVELSELQAKENKVFALHFPKGVARIVCHPVDACQPDATENVAYLEDIRKTVSLLKKKQVFQKDNLQKYGPKLLKVAECIVKAEGRQLVYAQDLENVFFLGQVLEEMGFKQLMLSPPNPPEQMTWTVQETKDSDRTYLVFSGSAAELETYVASFNKGVARLLLASTAMAEGVSLADVSDVHFLEPCSDSTTTLQVLARARRMCKNTSVTTVTPHVYMAGKHEKDVYDSTERKQKEINTWLELMQETAVDCSLHRKKCYIGSKTKKDYSLNTSTRTFFTGVESDGWTPIYESETSPDPFAFEREGNGGVKYRDKDGAEAESLDVLLTPKPKPRKRIKVEVNQKTHYFYVTTTHGEHQAMYKDKDLENEEVYGYITFGSPQHTFYDSNKKKCTVSDLF
jgi:thymidine kinase